MAHAGEGTSSGVNISDDEPPSGMLALGGNKGQLGIVNLATKTAKIDQYGREQINRVRFSPDGQYLWASFDRDLCKFSLEIERREIPIMRIPLDPIIHIPIIQSYEGHTDLIEDFCLLGQHIVYTCSHEDIKLWDFRLPNPLFHTLKPMRHSKCIDVLPTENVVLAGDAEGYLNSWDLRMQVKECSHVPPSERQSAITTITVSPDNSWICTGNNSGDFFEYKYQNKQYLLQHADLAHENSSTVSYGKCTFPRAYSGKVPVALTGSVGWYDSSDKHMHTRKIVDIMPTNSKILCCTANHDCTMIYSGTSYGRVVRSLGFETELDEVEVDEVLAYVKIGGAIKSLDFMRFR